MTATVTDLAVRTLAGVLDLDVERTQYRDHALRACKAALDVQTSVAKLRAKKTDTNLIVFDVDMTSGHGGASGRFDKLHELARAYTFVLPVKDRPDSRKR